MPGFPRRGRDRSADGADSAAADSAADGVTPAADGTADRADAEATKLRRAQRRRRWWHEYRSWVIGVVVAVVVVGAAAGGYFGLRNYGAVAPSSDNDASLLAGPSPSTPATTAASGTAAPPAAPTTAKGTVVAVTGPTWTMTVDPNLQLTVLTTATTGYGDGSLAQVVNGSTVTVTGTLQNGVLTATSVQIVPPDTTKKKKK